MNPFINIAQIQLNISNLRDVEYRLRTLTLSMSPIRSDIDRFGRDIIL